MRLMIEARRVQGRDTKAKNRGCHHHPHGGYKPWLLPSEIWEKSYLKAQGMCMEMFKGFPEGSGE